MTMSTQADLSERYRYAPHEVPDQEIQEALEELEAWRSMAEDKNIYEGPKEMKALVEASNPIRKTPTTPTTTTSRASSRIAWKA